ncbi:MAG TPA: c-type cytochrome [Candidatus Polarisedimenticolia bacterium]|nr:c-type cytochrome [Candidatus Polarisedimenticolia bacterium]
MKRLLVILVLFGMAGLVLWNAALRPKLNAVERGRRLAERAGCFGCHGPEGTAGTANPGRPEPSVPSFKALMMYAKSENEAREWIRDGVTASRRQSVTFRENREKGALRMPAFGKRLKPAQIEDLVAFVMAASGMDAPEDSLAAAGYQRAGELGCIGCHGAGGKFGRYNPRSLKGYIPSWDGADFPDLVRDRHEFEEWVERGRTKRFESNPMATYFLRRAYLHMPAYQRFLNQGDLDALWAYVTWIRTPHAVTASHEVPDQGADTTQAPADSVE